MNYTLMSQSEPVARKDYKCSWCGQVIAKGEKHAKQSGIFEGAYQTDRYHPECDKAAAADYLEWGEGHELYTGERPEPSAALGRGTEVIVNHPAALVSADRRT